MAYKKPSQTELASYFGIHRNTIKRYIKQFSRHQRRDATNFASLLLLVQFINWMNVFKKRAGKVDGYQTTNQET